MKDEKRFAREQKALDMKLAAAPRDQAKIDTERLKRRLERSKWAAEKRLAQEKVEAEKEKQRQAERERIKKLIDSMWRPMNRPHLDVFYPVDDD